MTNSDGVRERDVVAEAIAFAIEVMGRLPDPHRSESNIADLKRGNSRKWLQTILRTCSRLPEIASTSCHLGEGARQSFFDELSSPSLRRSPLSGRRICLRTDGRATGITFHGLVISTRLLVHGFGISRIGAGCLRSPLGIAHGARLVRLSHRPFLGGSHTRSVIGILSIGTREAQSERKGGCNDSCLHLRHSFTGVDNGQTFKCPGAALFPADWLPAP